MLTVKPIDSLDNPDAPVEAITQRVLHGMYLLANIEGGDVEHIVMLITGMIDYDMRCTIFHILHKKYPTQVRDLMQREITSTLERHKDNWRAALNHAISLEEQQRIQVKERERQERFSMATQKFKAMSVPSPEGTVDELSKRYGVSKGHIRMLKREGRLQELVGQQ